MSVLTTKEVAMLALKNTGALTGVKPEMATTGYDFIDAAIGGISGGEIMIVGARPNVGKSAQLLHTALKASEAGLKPHFLSLEDSTTIVGERLSSPHTGLALGSLRVDGHKYYRSGAIKALETRDWEDITFSFGAVRSLDVVLNAIREAVRGYGRNVIIIDYLTKIYSPGHPDMRTMIVSIVNELRAVAIELDVPLFIGAQLSRPVWNEKQSKYINEPEMSALKESAVIEESADLIIMSWAEDGARYSKVAKNKYNDYRPTWQWRFRQGEIVSEVCGGDL
jgi:replicative DNA helicase